NVIGMRMIVVAGLWYVTPTDTDRMIIEKMKDFSEANLAAFSAAISGRRPDEVAAAWLKPISRRTRANSRRLSRRGFKI
ncbi:MAG: antifreeze protein, partial [Tranquillimonas sp.]